MENENKEVKDVQDLEETKEEQTSETVEAEVENEEETTEALETVEEKKEEKKEEPYTGKEVTTSTKYDFKTFKYFNMYNSVVRRKLPVWYIVMGILALSFAIYSIVTNIIQHNADPEKVGFTSAILFGGVFTLFAVYLFRQSFKFEDIIDRTITNHFQTHNVAEQYIKVREDKITLIPTNKPEESFSYDWLQITSVEEIDEYIYLYIGKQPIIITKDPNNMIEGSYEDLMAIIDEKVATKPYRVYKKKFVKKPITFVHREDLEAKEQAETVEAENVETVNAEDNTQETVNETVSNETTEEVVDAEVVEEEKRKKNSSLK